MKFATFHRPPTAPRPARCAATRSSRSRTAPCSTGSPPATAPPPPGRPTSSRTTTLLEPIPRPPAIFCIGRNYAAHIEELKSEKPDKPLVFLKLPRSSAPPNGPVIRPQATQALDYETELVLVMGPDNDDRRLRRRQRRLRPRPAALREAVDARQGLRHVLPVGPVDHDGRRPEQPAHHHPRQRRAASGREHAGPDLQARRARRVHRRDLHARARRDHPHRHAERRRRGVRPAALPPARGHRALRGRRPRRARQ